MSRVSVTPSPTERSFPVVGIGASAGGFEAFSHLLKALPDEVGAAFILVQHTDPNHKSMLAELLSRVTNIPVLEARDGMVTEPSRVYVAPPGMVVTVSKGRLKLETPDDPRVMRMPIDVFFRSLALDQGNRAIGIVLSGTGTDGTLGLEDIKERGGITFVQDPKTSKFSGMPQSAISHAEVDFVLSPEEIAKRLVRLARHPYVAAPGAVPAPGKVAAPYGNILKLLEASHGVDFSGYKQTTISRRTNRRMMLLGIDNPGDYARYCREHPDELGALYHDLLIKVTNFFREGGASEALKRTAFPALFQDRPSGRPFRVWVPGCATGEEAYSIAILFLEYCAESQTDPPPFQIFATDVDDLALAKARSGTYIENINLHVSPERLRRFFSKEDHVYHINKRVRDCCIFARHNILKDPPFSNLDLVSCQNLLIYFDAPGQRHAISSMHYALVPNGFLILGGSETIGPVTGGFTLVDRKNKIYAKQGSLPFSPGRDSLDLDRKYRAREASHPPLHREVEAQGTRVREGSDLRDEADRAILGYYAAAGVLVDEHLDILQFRGDTGHFLLPAPGKASFNLLKMAREGLLVDLRAAMDEAKKTGNTASRGGITVSYEGGVLDDVMVSVIPTTPASAGPHYMVLFEEPLVAGAPPPKKGKQRIGAAAKREAGDLRVRQLQDELQATKDLAQSAIHERDAANEELRAANEEVLSANEELQSTNEELETAKEELQSTNEELITGNEELQQRNRELRRLNDDLHNLFSSGLLPIVLLGEDLRIRQFSSVTRDVLNLIPTDVGRPITDLRLNIVVPDLESELRRVISTGGSAEKNVQDGEGHWHLLKIRPYRTSDGEISGAVLVLINIDSVKDVERLERQARELADAHRLKDEFLAMLSHELRNPLAPIQNAVDLLRSAPGESSMQGEALEILDHELGVLTRLVDDLLDVSRVTTGRVRLQRADVDINEIVQHAANAVHPEMAERRHEFDVRLAGSPIRVHADAARMEQVLVNLLTNAAKYTPEGGRVWLSVARHEDEALIRVRDSGVGIDPTLLPYVFELFVQGKRSLDRKSGGLGIGLAVVKRLVELHGGAVTATSKGLGQGAEFVVSLPVVQAREAEKPKGAEPVPAVDAGSARDVGTDTQGLRVLVVEDNEAAAATLSMLLGQQHHDVRTCPDGAGALQSAREFRPDVAILDIGLPGMDGYELARRFRQEDGLGKVVLIAMTGYGQAEDLRRAREAGFDHHLVKPAQFNELRRILKSIKPSRPP